MGRKTNGNFEIEYKVANQYYLGKLGDETDFIDSGTSKLMIRIPKQLYAALKKQAHECETSLNLLCVSKLIAAIPCCPVLKCEIQPKYTDKHWRKPNGKEKQSGVCSVPETNEGSQMPLARVQETSTAGDVGMQETLVPAS